MWHVEWLGSVAVAQIMKICQVNEQAKGGCQKTELIRIQNIRELRVWMDLRGKGKLAVP